MVLWLLLLLLRIGFYTLFERKILGLSQLRKSPNKVGIIGIIMPILDGVKLIVKESISRKNRIYFIYMGRTILGFLLIRLF